MSAQLTAPSVDSKASAYRRDRIVIVLSLLGVAALAWVYLWRDATQMQALSISSNKMGVATMMAMSAPPIWNIHALLLNFLMWSVMMVGMMLPSAAPAILLYASLVRKNQTCGSVLPAVWIFIAGYLAMWTAFSLAATLVQALLQETLLLTPMMISSNKWLTGALLLAAGVYQWLPVKEICLEKCRSPLQYFLFRWRSGNSGAFRMGVGHGFFCVTCCWALMLLLFTAGVMNLIWVAIIAGFVFTEKLLPSGRLIGKISGIGMLVASGYVMLAT